MNTPFPGVIHSLYSQDLYDEHLFFRIYNILYWDHLYFYILIYYTEDNYVYLFSIAIRLVEFLNCCIVLYIYLNGLLDVVTGC